MYARSPAIRIADPKPSFAFRCGATIRPLARHPAAQSRVNANTAPRPESAFVEPTSSVPPSIASALPKPSPLAASGIVQLLRRAPHALRILAIDVHGAGPIDVARLAHIHLATTDRERGPELSLRGEPGRDDGKSDGGQKQVSLQHG